MKRWQIWLGVALTSASVIIYSLQIWLFESLRDTEFYLLQDLAFVPIQVLLITLLINRFLQIREKKVMMEKMNMLVGIFFSESGIALSRLCVEMDPEGVGLGPIMRVDGTWGKRHYRYAKEAVGERDTEIVADPEKLQEIKAFLTEKRAFLVMLITNPNLLEHDTFSEMMWAVLHVSEELSYRETLNGLPAADYQHLAADVRRAYRLLMQEWLNYMCHLQSDYPYLFSLAVRNNPFTGPADVVIRQ